MSEVVTVSSSLKHMAEILGEESIRAGSPDCSADGVIPAVIVTPHSPEEVAAIVRFSMENDLVVVPAGGFTCMSIGRVPPRIDVLLDLRALNNIAYYDPGDLTIGVGAGMTISELDAVLRPHGQWLPLDAALPERATIGGMLASAAQGPLRHAFGSVRDCCVGVQFVTADGLLAKAGGRVVKNVAGYDVTKLTVASYGTLAIIVGANFKLFPRPRQTQTFVARFHSLQEALQFRDRVLDSPLTPLALEIVSPFAENYLKPSLGGGAWNLVIRAAGGHAVLGRYRTELGAAVSLTLEQDEETHLWRTISDFSHTVIDRHPLAMLIEVSVPTASVCDGLMSIERSAADNAFFPAVIGRAGLGAIVAAFATLGDGPPAAMQYANAVSSLRAALPSDASAVIMRCPTAVKNHVDPWGSTPTDLESMRLVKQTMDPKDILNRGRFLF